MITLSETLKASEYAIKLKSGRGLYNQVKRLWSHVSDADDGASARLLRRAAGVRDKQSQGPSP